MADAAEIERLEHDPLRFERLGDGIPDFMPSALILSDVNAQAMLGLIDDWVAEALVPQDGELFAKPIRISRDESAADSAIAESVDGRLVQSHS